MDCAKGRKRADTAFSKRDVEFCSTPNRPVTFTPFFSPSFAILSCMHQQHFRSCGIGAVRIPDGYATQTSLLFPLSQTCDALSYMHQQHFLHRDVKPLNILVKLPPPANTKSPNKASISKQFRHAEARLADFGHSKNVEFFDFSSKATQGVGTRYFIAPESWGGIYSPLSDVYCLGMTMQWCRESGA